jgi:hypothetical protein
LENGVMVQVCSSMIANPERTPSIELYGSLDTFFFPSPIAESDGYESNLSRSLEGYRAWLEEDVPYRIPIEEAVPALAVVEAIYRSAENGKRERINQ